MNQVVKLSSLRKKNKKIMRTALQSLKLRMKKRRKNYQNKTRLNSLRIWAN